MNKLKQGKIICITCQKPATIPLKSPEEIKNFKNYKKGFNCSSCAFKFWDEKINNGETILRKISKDFQEQYRAEKNRQTNHE